MFSGWGLSWGGWLDNRRGEWWLLAQLSLITAHLFPAWPAAATWGLSVWPRSLVLAGTLLVISGLFMALQSFWVLGTSLSPLPAPKDGNQLVRSGPYSRARHPLYQAVLICSFGLTIALGSVLHLLLGLALAAVLRGKAKREEADLKALHPDYAAYQASTPAIVARVAPLDWRQ